MTETPQTQAERLDILEEHAAHQARMIDELSEQLNKQWATIETLRRRQKQLTDRLLTLEEQAHGAPPVTKPPHY